jgi:hypothetical protein
MRRGASVSRNPCAAPRVPVSPRLNAATHYCVIMQSGAMRCDTRASGPSLTQRSVARASDAHPGERASLRASTPSRARTRAPSRACARSRPRVRVRARPRGRTRVRALAGARGGRARIMRAGDTRAGACRGARGSAQDGIQESSWHDSFPVTSDPAGRLRYETNECGPVRPDAAASGRNFPGNESGARKTDRRKRKRAGSARKRRERFSVTNRKRRRLTSRETKRETRKRPGPLFDNRDFIRDPRRRG